jgi:hypothetical protein
VATESDDVSFYSQSISKVAQRALRESNKDSNGEREMTPSPKPYKPRSNKVGGVSNKLTWKEGFLKHKSMY